MSGSRLSDAIISVDFGTLGAGANSSTWGNSYSADATVTIGGTFGGTTVVVEAPMSWRRGMSRCAIFRAGCAR